MTTFTSNSSLGLIIDSDTSGNLNFIAGNTNVLSITSSGVVNIPSRFVVPVGDTASRPSATPGLIRFNNESGVFEASNGSAWLNVSTPPPFIVEYLVIAGGGSGGPPYGGGGGGAGGFRTDTGLTIVTETSYTVTVGAGGSYAASGTNSSFQDITAIGGGRGGSTSNSPSTGANGGSGGGGGGSTSSGIGTAGQGNNGGTSSQYIGGGGGGAGTAGSAATGTNRAVGGAGGDGLQSSITGTSTYYAGGGGGGSNSDGAVANSAGGLGGGGFGSGYPPVDAGSGAVNTGSGGGGAHQTKLAGLGGSGVVILKYSDTKTISNPGGGLTFTTDDSTVAGYKITTFTAGTGNIQWS